MTLTATPCLAATDLPEVMQTSLIDVCHAIKKGNKLALVKAVNASNLNFEKVVQDLRCNGMDTITFARYSQQADTAQYLASRQGKRSATLLAQAEK